MSASAGLGAGGASSRKSGGKRRPKKTKSPAESWERMWTNGIPPGLFFDAGKVEPALQQLIDAGTLPARGRVLVPGCGRGYAVAALASPTRHVLGLEISPSGAAVAKAQLAGVCNVAVVVGDFFGPFLAAGLEGRYDLIYDCTFLCALLPAQRALWPDRMRQLLRPGGVLVTDVFPVGTHTTGPPFAMSAQLLRSLLEPAGFACRSIAAVPPELVARPKTKSGEMIAVWVREDTAEVTID